MMIRRVQGQFVQWVSGMADRWSGVAGDALPVVGHNDN